MADEQRSGHPPGKAAVLLVVVLALVVALAYFSTIR